MTTRRLAAILAADVVGFSALMGRDEEGTLSRIKSLRREVLEPKVKEHQGRVFKTTGDGVLVEFASPVEAVRCAVSIQEALAVHAAQKPSIALQLRIGINLGDILIEEDGDVYGDGVNVAARLEQLAEPGGVCISSKIYEEVRDKLPYAFEDRGEQQVKNIARPVRMFALVGSRLGDQAIAAKPLPLPDKPSIAVLPFTNMSGDPEQEYFADGMVEDIITALSRVKWFFVIARNSSFTYKGKAVDIRQVGRELGVRYVLEGSIRKAGNRIRITGQLIEAVTGRHVWADRFDGDLADLFELQDRITESVVGAVEPSLRLAEIERARAKPTESLDAYDYYLRALPFHYAMRREKSDLALQLFAKAYELDPQFALAKATACGTYLFRKAQVWNQPGELEEGYRLALDAAALAPDDPQVLRLAGQAAVYLGRDYDYGLSLVQRAVTINPNSAQVLNSAAWTYNYYCDPSPAVEYFNRAMRLSPLDVEKPLMLSGLSFSYFLLQDYEAMLAHAVQAAKEMPTFVSAHRFATAALSCLGRMEEARHWAAQHMALAPNYRLEAARPILGWRDPAVVDHYFAALRAAGIPE